MGVVERKEERETETERQRERETERDLENVAELNHGKRFK